MDYKFIYEVTHDNVILQLRIRIESIFMKTKFFKSGNTLIVNSNCFISVFY